MARKKKEQIEATLCICGSRPVCVRCKGEAWKVVCLNTHCDLEVRGFSTAEKATKAWNEEVQRRVDAARKRY